MPFNGSDPESAVIVQYWLPTHLLAGFVGFLLSPEAIRGEETNTAMLARTAAVAEAVAQEFYTNDPDIAAATLVSDLNQGAMRRVEFAKAILPTVFQVAGGNDALVPGYVTAVVSDMWTKFNQEYGP